MNEKLKFIARYLEGEKISPLCKEFGLPDHLSVATGTTTPVLTANIGTIANPLAAGNDSRITGVFQSLTSLGGDLTGTLPNPVLASLVTAGTAAKETYDAKGRITFGSVLAAAATVLSNSNTAGSLLDLVCVNTAGAASVVPFAYSIEYITP